MKGRGVIPKFDSHGRRGLVLLSYCTLAFFGCSGGGDRPSGAPEDLLPAAQPMSEAVQELVNQGNLAQREGRYEDALALYREAMDQTPEHPVPQFGGLMAAMALGDEALGDSLRHLLETSSPELLAMLEPGGAMGDGGGMPGSPHAGMGAMMPPGAMRGASPGGGMPPGHPVVIEITTDTTRPDTAGGR